MPTGDGSLTAIIGILAVLVLVAANGFFVAAEFSLVAVRRSRVAQLVAGFEACFDVVSWKKNDRGGILSRL